MQKRFRPDTNSILGFNSSARRSLAGCWAFLFLLVAIVAFSLTRLYCSDPVYTWMGGVFLLLCGNRILNFIAACSQYIDANVSNVLTDAILWPLVFGWLGHGVVGLVSAAAAHVDTKGGWLANPELNAHHGHRGKPALSHDLA